MADRSDKKLRIPVRCIEGRWEVEFGGNVPVAHGQAAELIVPEKSINDPAFLKAMKQRNRIKILDRGTPLRVLLAVKELEGVSVEQRKYLLPWDRRKQELAPGVIDRWSSGPLGFFEVFIGSPRKTRVADPELAEGGLWLEIEGRKAVRLLSSTFALPTCVSEEPAISLNHAFTILSEVYEPWRMSHTGSVYERFLYQEANELWYPLSLLRDASLATNDQMIAKKLWDDFLRRVAPSSSEGMDL